MTYVFITTKQEATVLEFTHRSLPREMVSKLTVHQTFKSKYDTNTKTHEHHVCPSNT